MQTNLDKSLVLTADEILKIKSDTPETLFQYDINGVIRNFLALAKKWHLDIDHDPETTAVLWHLVALHKNAESASRLALFGTDGNVWGKTIVGGSDVKVINALLQSAFDEGHAGLQTGPVNLIGQYKGRNVFEQQAADQIRISVADDGRVYVKLIVRGADPGMGLLALAGGFKEKNETDEAAADREEKEEAADKEQKGIKSYVVAKHQITRHPVKGDVRQWSGKDRADGVKKGSVIAMSTTAMVIISRNAHGVVEAGDDAQNAAWVPVDMFDGNTATLFGIKGHAEMLDQALRLAHVSVSPDFSQAVEKRSTDITVATPELAAAAQSFIASAAEPNAQKIATTGESQPSRTVQTAATRVEPLADQPLIT